MWRGERKKQKRPSLVFVGLAQLSLCIDPPSSPPQPEAHPFIFTTSFSLSSCFPFSSICQTVSGVFKQASQSWEPLSKFNKQEEAGLGGCSKHLSISPVQDISSVASSQNIWKLALVNWQSTVVFFIYIILVTRSRRRDLIFTSLRTKRGCFGLCWAGCCWSFKQSFKKKKNRCLLFNKFHFLFLKSLFNNRHRKCCECLSVLSAQHWCCTTSCM